jgi:hypothetical protein
MTVKGLPTPYDPGINPLAVTGVKISELPETAVPSLAQELPSMLANVTSKLTISQILSLGDWLPMGGGTLKGKLITLPSSAPGTGLRVTPGIDPTAPVDGDVWVTATSFNVRVNSVTKDLFNRVPEAPTDGKQYVRQSGAWNDFSDEMALKAPLASPALTGNPTAPTPAAGDNDTSIATTAFVQAVIVSHTHPQSAIVNLVPDLALKAPLLSPALTGNPTAPTPPTADNDTSIATTAHVQANIATRAPLSHGHTQGEIANLSIDLALKAPLSSPAFTGNPTGPTPAPGDNDVSLATTAFVRAALLASGAIATAYERNYVFNSAFQISQENLNTVCTHGEYPADQWFTNFTGLVGWTSSRIALLTPSGSIYRIRLSYGTLKPTLAANDYAAMFQYIEGVNLTDLQWGTPNAKPVVLRFGVRGLPAGTYSAAIRNGANDRSYVVAFTVGANEQKEFEFAIPGDTSGVWDTGWGNRGMTLSFALASGTTFQIAPNVWTTTSVGAFAAIGQTNGAAVACTPDFFDVGIYLDPNGTGKAPPFLVPDFNDDLIACQRYYERDVCSLAGAGWVVETGAAVRFVAYSAVAQGNERFRVEKRTYPTMTAFNPTTGAAGSWKNLSNNVDTVFTLSPGNNGFSYVNNSATFTHVYCGHWAANARM